MSKSATTSLVLFIGILILMLIGLSLYCTYILFSTQHYLDALMCVLLLYSIVQDAFHILIYNRKLRFYVWSRYVFRRSYPVSRAITVGYLVIGSIWIYSIITDYVTFTGSSSVIILLVARVVLAALSNYHTTMLV